MFNFKHLFLNQLNRALYELILAIPSGDRKYHISTTHRHTDRSHWRLYIALEFLAIRWDDNVKLTQFVKAQLDPNCFSGRWNKLRLLAQMAKAYSTYICGEDT